MEMSRGVRVMLCVLGVAVALLQLQCDEVSAEGIAMAGGVSEAFSQRDTDTTLHAAANFLKCTSDLHVTATSTKDVSDLIKLHTSCKSKPVKIRATHRNFHSSAGFACPGDRADTKKVYEVEVKYEEYDATKSITMLHDPMNRVVSVDAEHHKLTVEAGMTFHNLADAAQANGMSVPIGVLPDYGKLTVGGVIAASAHGTGLGVRSSLGDLVTRVKWVNGRGEILVSESATEAGAREVKALVGGLGLLGIITEVTLQLEPLSRTVVEDRKDLDDSNLVSELKRMLRHETPHVVVQWRPDFGKYRAVLFKPEAANIASAPEFRPEGRGAYMHAVDDDVAGALSQLMAAWESDADEKTPAAAKLNADVCSTGEMFLRTPFFRDGDGAPIDHATIPTNYATLAPECTPKCLYQSHHMGAISDNAEFTIKFSQLEDWVKDVKAVVRSELEEIQVRLDERYGQNKVKRCMSPGYFLLRFGQGSNSLLATNAGADDVAYVELVFMESALTPNKPAKAASIFETIEQLSMCKYKARPHWGKSTERVFRHPKCHVRDNFPASNIASMLRLQRRHDPLKVFQPELFQRLVEKSGPAYAPQCSLAHWCYCEEDAHCPHGHACQPSPLFPEYKICKLKLGAASAGHAAV